MRAIKERRVWGHIEHPSDGKPDLNQAAVIITGLNMRQGGEIYGTLETLSTDAGLKAKALFEDGLSVGISSRAHGSVRKNSEGIDEVQQDFMPESFDLVAEPSTPGAYLRESLQKELTEKGVETVRQNERWALAQVQLDALKEECENTAGWRSIWQNRLNDIKFFARDIPKDRIEEMQSAIVDLQTILHKKKRITESQNPYRRSNVAALNKSTVNLLIEQAENAAKEATKAAQDAAKAAKEAAKEQTSSDKAPVDAEVAATQAKIAAGEAEAAVQAAKSAETEVGVQIAAQQAAAAAEKAKSAAADAVAATGAETTVGETPEEKAVADTKICHTVDVVVDFERLSDAAKKKINVFRPGEELTTARTLIASEMEALSLPVKELYIIWAEDKIRVKVEVDGDPDKAKGGIMGLLELKPVAATPEPTPDATAIPQTQNQNPPVTSESFAIKMAHQQRVRELHEENRRLRQEVTRLGRENANLKILNNEMTGMFESEIMKFETAALIRKYPALKKVESFLIKCKSLPALHEMADQFRAALIENEYQTPVVNPAPRKEEPYDPEMPEEEPEIPEEEPVLPEDYFNSGLPPMPLQEGAGRTVTDGAASSGGNMYSRLAEHRARKKRR